MTPPESEAAPVTAAETRDPAKWTVACTVEKFDADTTRRLAEQLGRQPSGDDFAAAGLAPYDVVHVDGNLLTTAGLTRLMNLLIGAGGQALTATSGRIGVGNSSTAEAVGQTDLQAAAGSSNRYFQPFDATYPQVAAGVLTAKATFASADGNFAWAEWGIDIGTPTVAGGTTVNATLLNRKVAANGTKTAGQAWAFTVTITIS